VAPYQRCAKRRGAEFHGILTRPDGPLLAKIGALVESGVIHPVVGKVYTLNELGVAYQDLATGHTRGKIVLQIAVQD
jgi:NADPH:quinone reductase-like Zn-dependent oxidoreductase